jgi:hypothetical protein
MPVDSAGATNRSRLIPSARLLQIEEVAKSLRGQADSGAILLGIETPTIFDLIRIVAGPVRPVANLSRNGVRLAGMLDCTGPLPQISYEAYDIPARQRFSVAHELAHLVLHEISQGSQECGCSQTYVDPQGIEDDPDAPDEEAEADAFAAAFLMPADSLKAAVAQFGFGSGFLAERFGVSEKALRRRWATLCEEH